MDPTTLQSLLSGMSPGGNVPVLGGSMGGAAAGAGAAVFEELQKALQASNYQTDVSTLTGGGALGVQSLDTAMKTTIQENEHFTLFNRLARTNATNIVDEYTRQTSVGGFLGGSTNTQMGVVRAAQGEYAREIGLVKFFMSMRQVGYILNIGKNITSAEAVEERNGALQLLTDANYLLYHGNAAASPTQYDGVFAQIDNEITAGRMNPDCVIDMRGKPITSVTPFSQINVAVSGYGSWGRSTDVFMPNSVQNDLNASLDPAYRWLPDGSNQPVLGGHVPGIRLTNGVLKTNMDTFIQDEQNPMVLPFEVNNGTVAVANNSFQPTVAAVAAAGDAASQFTAPQAGNYYYAVAGIGAGGQGYSQCVLTGAEAVSAGGKVTLTITRSVGQGESGYAIYRSRQNGTNALKDLRLMKVVPCAGATTTFVDENADIPGTITIPLLNLGPSADAIGWRQFQPMTKIPLPFGIGGQPVISWFQFLFGYLRMTKPKHHGYIKNILPSNAVWQPFAVT